MSSIYLNQNNVQMWRQILRDMVYKCSFYQLKKMNKDYNSKIAVTLLHCNALSNYLLALLKAALTHGGMDLTQDLVPWYLVPRCQYHII